MRASSLELRPFSYNSKWLTGKTENEELVGLAKRRFEQFYGLDPDKCELIDPQRPA